MYLILLILFISEKSVIKMLQESQKTPIQFAIIYGIHIFLFIDWLKARHVIKNKLTHSFEETRSKP